MKQKRFSKLRFSKKVILSFTQLNTLQGGVLIKSTKESCTNSTAPQCGISTGVPTCRLA